MKKISIAPRKSPGAQVRLMSRTGSHCPANGFWRADGDAGDPVFVFEGSIMPTGVSGATVWFLEDGTFGPPAHPLAGPRLSRSR